MQRRNDVAAAVADDARANLRATLAAQLALAGLELKGDGPYLIVRWGLCCETLDLADVQAFLGHLERRS